MVSWTLHNGAHLCDRFSITPVQLHKWLKLWNKHKQQWLGILEDSETSDAFFLKVLAVSDSYSSFSMSFIRRFTCNFLQSHKNPTMSGTKAAHCCQHVFQPDISIW